MNREQAHRESRLGAMVNAQEAISRTVTETVTISGAGISMQLGWYRGKKTLVPLGDEGFFITITEYYY